MSKITPWKQNKGTSFSVLTNFNFIFRKNLSVWSEMVKKQNEEKSRKEKQKNGETHRVDEEKSDAKPAGDTSLETETNDPTVKLVRPPSASAVKKERKTSKKVQSPKSKEQKNQ